MCVHVCMHAHKLSVYGTDQCHVHSEVVVFIFAETTHHLRQHLCYQHIYRSERGREKTSSTIT